MFKLQYYRTIEVSYAPSRCDSLIELYKMRFLIYSFASWRASTKVVLVAIVVDSNTGNVFLDSYDAVYFGVPTFIDIKSHSNQYLFNDL